MAASRFLSNMHAVPHDAGHFHMDSTACANADFTHENHLNDHFSAFLSGSREAKLAENVKWQSDVNFMTNTTIASTVMNGISMVLALGSGFCYYFATQKYRKALNREEFPMGLPVNVEGGGATETTLRPDDVEAEACQP